MSEPIPMRQVFGQALVDLAERFPDLVVLDADCSASTQTRLFSQRFPERFFNFGIAEGNMVAAAAGMAACGLLPVVSAFAFLLTLRAGDPLRSLVAYTGLNVKLAAGYAGLSDHADGASHQSVLDLAVARALPNLTVLVPSDIETTRGAVRAMLERAGPVYLRLSRAPVGSCHGGSEDFAVGRASILRDGADVALACCGTLLPAVLRASELLGRQGISATVAEFATLKPLDRESLVRMADKTGAVVSVEEHTILGGFGSAVAEELAEHGGVRLRRVGIRDSFGESGTYESLLEKHGLTASEIAEAARDLLGARGRSR